MKVVVVFESMFGNTESLAAEIGRGLAEGGADAVMVEVGTATPQAIDGYDLMVLAAPTHALSLSKPQSRAEAVLKGADPRRASTGVREWLNSLEGVVTARPPVVVFDTRVFKARHWPGSAAKRAARTLRQQGFTILEQSSFFVDDVKGPLTPGELERAHTWGVDLAAAGSDH